MDAIANYLTVDNIIEIAGLLVGLAYLYFEYHANRMMWLMSVIMPMISMWVYFRAGIYADFAINIYYLVIAVYGNLVWTFGLKRDKPSPVAITHTPVRMYLWLTVVLLAIYALLCWLLIDFTNSTVPYYDAFTTALSIVAMWMLARKYIEQWIAWFIVDAVCVGLYIYKGIFFYAVLYAIYTIIALLGYRNWLRLMRQQ